MDIALLLIVMLEELYRLYDIHVILFEYIHDLVGFEFFMRMIADRLHEIAERFSHILRQYEAESVFKQICYAALARLAVYADDVRFVNSADVVRVDRKIRHVPHLFLVRLAEVHTLGDSVLVRAAERREHESAAVRLTVAYVKTRSLFVRLADCGHIRKIETGIYALHIHIHRHGNDIRVTRAFAVAEEGALYPVRACEQAQFAIRDRATSVVVRVKGYQHVFSVVQVLGHKLYLLSVHVRRAHFYGSGQVDYDFSVRRRLPDIYHRVAYFKGKFRLRTRKAFRRILEKEIAFSLFRVFEKEFRARNGYIDYFILGFFENLLSLRYRGRVVQVNYRPLRAFERLKSLCDYVFSRLREHLYRHVVRDKIFLYESAQEFVFRFARGGETYLYLFETYFAKESEKFQLLVEAHRYDERLVSVAQINAAPHGSLVYRVLSDPVVALHGRHKVTFAVLFKIFHIPSV